MSGSTDITVLLSQAGAGDASASERLLPLVYEELRVQADRFIRRERSDHTLEPTALVHEAYLNLVDQTRVVWNDRNHFYAVASTAMRRILVNHARHRGRIKRGGEFGRVSLDKAAHLTAQEPPDLIALDEALSALQKLDERKARIVELRFFGGMRLEDVADALDCSMSTVKRDWELARTWLLRQLAQHP
ncbi:MAG: sigma-70 family RNA polymerase sigma factor [Phycisphaerales bacterium]|nr:sigma-70 family RNA polymerase sigma factor [Phycisphaerales bacterium]